ncbi:MAG: hypothetical protein KF882_02595 [Bacteroidia bacterium]|nr:hypothetical protein [Bacteroidia bacterium]MCO5253651.1 hypothetical protein [Bacteroidota bacterium]
MAKTIDIPSGFVLVMDRAYVDFHWLHILDCRRITFVIRLKENKVKDKTNNIIKDQIIVLTGINTATNYPKQLRLVVVYEPDK